MDSQDGRPLSQVRQGDLHLAVEAAGAKQRGVQDLGAVRCGDDHHPDGGIEPVHLRQELIERLFALVVGHEASAAALPDGVDLVDENDGGSALTGTGEQITHPRGAQPHEQLDEARAGDGEERDAGLSGHRPGHEGLPGAGRPDHQHSSGTHGPDASVAIGILEEVDDLRDLPLGAVVAGDVREGRRGALLVVELGPRPGDPGEAGDPASQLAPRSPPHVPEDAEQQQER